VQNASRRRRAADPFDYEDFLSSREDPKESPLDPAVSAARTLIKRGLRRANTRLRVAAGDGAVTLLVVPDPSWVTAVYLAWREWARPAATGRETAKPRGRADGWLSWCRTDEPSARERTEDADKFAGAVMSGIHCLGVAPDVARLPRDLVTAADHRLVLPQLRPWDVATLASVVCEEWPDAKVAPAVAAALTPRLLRLARRPRQSADDYIRRLSALVAAEGADTVVAARSPRELPTLDRLHGMDEAADWGRSLAASLDAYRAGSLPWGDVEAGCLLSGPPGCGKTLFARAGRKLPGAPRQRVLRDLAGAGRRPHGHYAPGHARELRRGPEEGARHPLH
jgi:hypothetical protein